MTEAAVQAEGQVEASAQTPEAQGETPATATHEATWYDNAPDEVKGYIQNKGWDDPLKAVEGYKNLEQFHGVDPDRLLKLPKDGEPMDEIYDRLGRPEDATGYEFSAPEGMEVDEGRLTGFKQKAHEIGINQAQFEQLAAWDAEFMNSAIAAANEAKAQQQEAELEAVKKEMGEGFQERAELGRRFIKNNLPSDVDKDGLLNAIEDAIGTGNMIRLFGNAGANSAGEDKVPDSGGDRPYGYTKEQAAADKSALMSELKADTARLEAYNKGVGADYDKMKRLNKLLSS